MSQQFGLGRGLSSLIPNKQPAAATPQTFQNAEEFSKRTVSATDESIRGDNFVMEVDVNLIVANPHQPRNLFDDEKLQNLADSIKLHGIIQPLIVTRSGNKYELIAGERRLQASQLVGLKKVPVIIREASELQKLELAIIENVQRHDLNAIEEGKAYQKLADEYQMSQEEIASKMGKSRSLVANKMRLLTLPVEIQKGLIDGKITEGHAKAILSLSNPEKQRALYEIILKGNLTVRQVEEKTKEVSVRSYERHKTADPQMKELENKLVEVLGTKVKISKAGDGGKIVIEYYSQEDLDSLLGKIAHE
ncbi:MAG: ParB-like protein partition protein [Candidatus Moranbacteria bacterium GW2011_GWE1_36_7]|nr:MAG: ParB-like protein partition protein [Candidatus Moranbacteria bacterium GW2011_GWD2_36_12]KKQ06881.1 MAG: ParB-like protein partition protein [Candidatus Moranbacteria bacterium GW2011_GWE2_36_40]KKQ14742.1 MAG: ParB-like protein partition protein [Candidatus Moranbacteria bacterium GW2011_GWE1_36_7]